MEDGARLEAIVADRNRAQKHVNALALAVAVIALSFVAISACAQTGGAPEGTPGGECGTSTVTPGGSCAPTIVNKCPRIETPRGRVKVIDNRVLTDTGKLLRAAQVGTQHDVDWWREQRDRYGLNTMRLGVRITTTPTNARYDDSKAYLNPDLEKLFKGVDHAVAIAEQAGMYIIIANFTSCCGEYHTDLNRIFWDIAAPRYKDREHVLYELQNEPVPGSNYDAEAIAFQADMYDFIRQRAPQTHIVLWSVMYGAKANVVDVIRQAPSIDYSNASVGVHPYHFATQDPNFANLRRLRSLYPVFSTEYSFAPKKQSRDIPGNLWKFLEEERISWSYLDLQPIANGGYGDFGNGVARPCDWTFLWPAPAE